MEKMKTGKKGEEGKGKREKGKGKKVTKENGKRR